jgi:acyl-CoA reductase-like NAD-dependent aldehyde dehydrogenase
MSAPKMFAHHWIGGEWVDSEKRMESMNPANGETIGTYTEAGEATATRVDLLRFDRAERTPTLEESRSVSRASDA